MYVIKVKPYHLPSPAISGRAHLTLMGMGLQFREITNDMLGWKVDDFFLFSLKEYTRLHLAPTPDLIVRTPSRIKSLTRYVEKTLFKI